MKEVLVSSRSVSGVPRSVSRVPRSVFLLFLLFFLFLIFFFLFLIFFFLFLIFFFLFLPFSFLFLIFGRIVRRRRRNVALLDLTFSVGSVDVPAHVGDDPVLRRHRRFRPKQHREIGRAHV